MTFDQAMKALQDCGKEQYCKIFRRHGAKDPMFGCNFADMGKLAKQIKRDHDLAVKLWDSGNYDAKLFATMIADPAKLDGAALDRWAKGVDCPPVAGEFGKLAARSPSADPKMRQWQESGNEFLAEAGYMILAQRISSGDLPDEECRRLLKQIEREIHGSKNRVKYMMNNVVICIGARGGDLIGAAMESATRIGKVEVDHGETGCKTPDAIPYMKKMLERKKGKGQKAEGRKANSARDSRSSRQSAIGNRKSRA